MQRKFRHPCGSAYVRLSLLETTTKSSNSSSVTEAEIKDLIAQELAKPVPDWQVIEKASRGLVDQDPDSVRFTVDAGHIQRLGVELVGKQDTALSELIKNAYDADATKVELTFRNHGQKGGSLTIVDDGSGMSDQAIRNSWMRISTAAKVEEPRSTRFDRVRAGKKGIGRFAVQRLGKRLLLESKPLGAEFGFRVTFEWDDAFKAGTDLQEVFNKIERFEKEADDSGTRLVITDLRDAWSDAALSRAWRSVMLLQPPFKIGAATSVGKLTDPGFSVIINGATDAQQKSRYSIEDTFLKQAIAVIEAGIDDAGNAVARVTSPKLDLSDTESFGDKFTLTGPISLKVHYFIFDAKLMSGMSMRDAAEMGRVFGGVRVYRNGFRVLPYGQSSDDWLQLDADVSRRSLLVPANNRNFFGHVELNADENPLFEETSSREGLLENEAYDELRRFARQSIEWAVLRIANARQRKQTAGQPNFVSITKKPSEVVRDLKKTLTFKLIERPESVAKAVKAIEKVESALADYEADVEKDKAASVEYQEMLRILASLGLSISVFGHEIRGAREAMQAHILALKDAIAALSDGDQKRQLETKQQDFQSASDRVFDIGGYIDGLMSRTESRELISISVKGALGGFAKQFGDYMAKQRVQFEIDVPDPTLRTTLMHKSEMDSMLLNLLTNSIKSMRKAEIRDRKVRLDARKEDRHIVLGFEDNGGGISPEYRHRVFDAFFTTTMAADDDGVAGPGTGLGLKIVSDIVESYGGSARVADATEGYNCRIELRVLAAGAEA